MELQRGGSIRRDEIMKGDIDRLEIRRGGEVVAHRPVSMLPAGSRLVRLKEPQHWLGVSKVIGGTSAGETQEGNPSLPLIL